VDLESVYECIVNHNANNFPATDALDCRISHIQSQNFFLGVTLPDPRSGRAGPRHITTSSTAKGRARRYSGTLQPRYNAYSGGQANQRFNETSIIMKCTFWISSTH